MAKRRWSQAAIDSFRAANNGAFPPGQEPEAPDYSAQTTDDKARITYALAHGKATGADSAAARVYGVLPDEPKPKTAAQVLAERRASAELKYANNPASMTRADSTLAGVKPEKAEKSEALTDRIVRYAKRRSEIGEMMGATLETGALALPGKKAPGIETQEALYKADREYADSLDLANMAMEARKTWLPQYDQDVKTFGEAIARRRLLKASGQTPEGLRSTLKIFE